jgi:hypothetical protein
MEVGKTFRHVLVGRQIKQDRKQEEVAAKRKKSSEQAITELLADGWQIVQVVPYVSSGATNPLPPYSGRFVQETWTVFLQKSN